MNAKREAELSTKVLDAFTEAGIATMTQKEKSWYLTSNIQLAYHLLRSVEGDDWLRGWLEAAIADLKKPPEFSIRKPS